MTSKKRDKETVTWHSCSHLSTQMYVQSDGQTPNQMGIKGHFFCNFLLFIIEGYWSLALLLSFVLFRVGWPPPYFVRWTDIWRRSYSYLSPLLCTRWHKNNNIIYRYLLMYWNTFYIDISVKQSYRCKFE
jgi:hypothetical protein